MKINLLLIFLFSFCVTKPPLVLAQEMSSENYKLQGGMLDMTSGTVQNTEKNSSLSTHVGNTNAGVFNSKGYLINPSLVFGEATSEFSLSLSSDRIPYEGLDRSNAAKGNLTIQIQNGNNPGFSVFILENEPLTTHAGTQIPDTLCSKSFPCTVQQASSWTETDVFGLGYRVDGKTAVSDFDITSSFKSLPSQKRTQDPSLILSSNSRKTKEEATVTFDVRPAKTQPNGQYHNIIHVIAVPGI